MKIQPIYNARIAFKSRDYEDDGILGYDDKPSQDVCQAIRNWQEIYYTPYQSLYKKECNLSEYQMNQLLGSLMKGPKVVDYSKVTGIPAYHVRPVEGTDEIKQSLELKVLKGSMAKPTGFGTGNLNTSVVATVVLTE